MILILLLLILVAGILIISTGLTGIGIGIGTVFAAIILVVAINPSLKAFFVRVLKKSVVILRKALSLKNILTIITFATISIFIRTNLIYIYSLDTKDLIYSFLAVVPAAFVSHILRETLPHIAESNSFKKIKEYLG